MRILAVDDDVIILDLLKEVLVSIGHDFKSGVPGLILASYRGKALAILEATGVEAQPVRVFNL